MARRYSLERAAFQCSYTSLLHLLALLHPPPHTFEVTQQLNRAFLIPKTLHTDYLTHSQYVHGSPSYSSGGDPIYHWSYEIVSEPKVLLRPNFTVNNDSHIPAPSYATYLQYKLGRMASIGTSTNKRRSHQLQQPSSQRLIISVKSVFHRRCCYCAAAI